MAQKLPYYRQLSIFEVDDTLEFCLVTYIIQCFEDFIVLGILKIVEAGTLSLIALRNFTFIRTAVESSTSLRKNYYGSSLGLTVQKKALEKYRLGNLITNSIEWTIEGVFLDIAGHQFDRFVVIVVILKDLSIVTWCNGWTSVLDGRSRTSGIW